MHAQAIKSGRSLRDPQKNKISQNYLYNMLNPHDQLLDSPINLPTQRLKKYLEKQTRLGRKAFSSLSDFQSQCKLPQNFKKEDPQHKNDRKTKKKINGGCTNFAKINECMDYLQLWRKTRKNGNFLFSNNLHERPGGENKKFISLLTKNRKANAVESCLQNKKKYYDILLKNKLEKQSSKLLLLATTKKCFPLLNHKMNTPDNDKNKKLSYKMLQFHQLKMDLDLKNNKNIRFKSLQCDNHNVCLLTTSYFDAEKFEITSIKKFKIQQQRTLIQKQKRYQFENLEELRNRKIKSKTFKIFPTSFSFKDVKEEDDGFSPWQSQITNFADNQG